MIYVVQHNDEMYVSLMEGYETIKVGKLFEDDGRDNINYLNPYINETTALYDIWKNHNEDIVGMIHYRRVFFTDNDFRALTFDKAKEFMKSKKLICTKYHTLGESTIYDYFRYSIQITSPRCLPTFDKYMLILEEKDPKVIEYFHTHNRFFARNMFIARKEVIDKYCEWLFPIIIPMTEQFIEEDIKKGKVLGQERLLGHFVERMFSYWIEEVLGVEDVGALHYLTY